MLYDTVTLRALDCRRAETWEMSLHHIASNNEQLMEQLHHRGNSSSAPKGS